MAIDHRIIQQIGVRNNAPALNMFQNAMAASQNRDAQKQQMEQQAALQPFRQQLLEQQVAQGQQQATQGRQQQILKSVNDFALSNRSLIQNAQSTGDFTGLRGALVQRREQLIQQDLPTETTDQGLALIDAGQGGQVVSSLGDAVNLFNQQQGRSKSAGQRELENLLSLAQDPNSTQLEKDSANRALGNLAKVGSLTSQERLGGDTDLTTDVARSQAEIAEAKSTATEGAKLKQQRKHKPAITAAVKIAEKEAIEKGEV